MIETVVASALPVDEMMRIEKNRLEPEHPVERPKRMVIVTGTHGDELEGQFCCYEIIRRIKEHKEYLNGIVDVFPALNPLGIDTITRGIPGYFREIWTAAWPNIRPGRSLRILRARMYV